MGNDLIKILLQAEVNPKAIIDIQKQIEGISKDAQAIKINVEVDSKAFKAIENINKSISNVSQQAVGSGGFKDLSNDISLATKSLSDLELKNNKTFYNAKGEVTKYSETIKQAGIIITETFKDIEKKVPTGSVFDDKSAEYNAKQAIKSAKEQQKSIEQRIKLEQDYENWWLKSLRNKEIKEAEISKKNIENINTERQVREDMYKQLFIQLEKQENKTQQSLDLYKQKMLGGNGFTGELDIFANKQKGKFDERALAKIRNDVEGLNISTPDLNNKIKLLGVQFNSLKQSASQSGSVMTRMFENMTKFMRFYLAGGILVRIVSEIKNGVESVKLLDSSLTELAKVSDLTSTQLSEFTDRAYDAGKTIGRTGKEVIDATAEFKRAGYDIEQAFELSQQALLLTNIGDGIDDVKEASSSLIAILKGFKMEASETAHIVDALNEVSNDYAVDTNNLTEILKRASGTIGQTGTSYEQLIGLATGGYESLRNAEMVASGLNYISQRLRGMEEDGTKVEGLIPKIQAAFDKYTNGAVSMIDKQNGGLHSTYEVLEQLSKVYPTLSDEAKAYLNEAVASNRQNKVLVAIMENWKNVESATASATNSLGSANAENEKYLKSIEGRISLLSSSTETFWKNLINSDTIKLFVDSMTSLINVLDKLVNNEMSSFIVQTGILTAAIYGLGVGIKYLAGTEVAIKFATMLKLMTANSLGLSAGVAILNKTLLASPLIKIAAIVAGITLVVKAVDHFTTSLKEQKEVVATLSSEINNLQSEYDNLKSKENKTEDEKAYLKLLEQEKKHKEDLLKIETERLIQQEFFNREVRGKDARVIDSGADKVKKDIEELISLQQQLNRAATDGDWSKYNELNEKVLGLKISLTDTLKTIKDYTDKMDGDVSYAFINLRKSIESVILEEDKMEDATVKATSVAEKFFKEIEKGSAIFNDTEDSQEKLKKIIDGSVKSYEDITSKIQAYNVILDELNSKEGMSSKSKQDIITKYHELLPYINNEKELRKQLIEIIKREEEVQLQAYNNMLMYSEDFYNSKIKGNKDLVDKLGEYYDKDLENAKSLAEAKAMVEQKLITNLARLWSNFYKVSAIAGEGYVQTLGDRGIIDDFGRNASDIIFDELREVSKLFDDIVADFTTPDFKDINLSGIKEKKDKKDDRQFLESIDAEIRAIKLKNDNLLKTEKLLQEQLKLAKDLEGIEGLNEQYRITGELIEHNKKMLQSFKTEQDLIHARANKLREDNTKYNIDSWFDSNGEATLTYINLYNNATKKQQEELDKVFGTMQKLKKAWMESKDEVEKIVDANKQLVVEQDKLIEQHRELSRQNWVKEQNKLYDEQQDRLKALEDIQEKIVAIIRKRGEEEKKALDEAHKAEIDSLEERHKDRKKKYQEELDLFKKTIQEKIDTLDRQNAEEDYIEELNKERKKANELQREIDVLSLDDSLTARNKTTELRKQLADQNEKIAKMQQNRERDLLKKSLQDQLKNKEENTKQIEEIADKTYENEKKRLEEDYKINKEFLEQKYSDEKVYAEARQSLIDGQVEVAKGRFESIYDAYVEFEDKFGKGMGYLGDIIKKDFTDKLEEARKAIEKFDYETKNKLPQYQSDYNPSNIEMGYTSPNNTTPKYSVEEYGKFYMDARAKGDWQTMEWANRQANILRGIGDVVTSAVDIEAIKKKYGGSFKHGAEILSSGLMLTEFHGRKDDPEWIFNSSQLQKVLKDTVLSTIKIASPKVPNVAPQQGVMLQIDNLINVEGNVTKDTIPLIKSTGNDIVETLKNLNKGGIFRPVKR